MEPVIESVVEAASELPEVAADYTEQFDVIMRQLSDVVTNQEYTHVVLGDLLENMQLQMKQLSVLADHMLQLVDFMRYVAGFTLFFVIIAILVFSYKFLRMFI